MGNNGHKEVVARVPAFSLSMTPEQLIRLVSEAVTAGVTQLVESLPSKQVGASSNLVSRSTDIKGRLINILEKCQGDRSRR